MPSRASTGTHARSERHRTPSVVRSGGRCRRRASPDVSRRCASDSVDAQATSRPCAETLGASRRAVPLKKILNALNESAERQPWCTRQQYGRSTGIERPRENTLRIRRCRATVQVDDGRSIARPLRAEAHASPMAPSMRSANLPSSSCMAARLTSIERGAPPVTHRRCAAYSSLPQQFGDARWPSCPKFPRNPNHPVTSQGF